MSTIVENKYKAAKVPLHLVPDIIVIEAAVAFAEGYMKYGKENWRTDPILASDYISALRRHQIQWWCGEEADPKTGVKHLASVIANAGIILDAQLNATIVDDRPRPSSVLSGRMEAAGSEARGASEAVESDRQRQQ